VCAYTRGFLCGWLGKALRLAFYGAFRSLALLALVLRLGPLNLGLWNFVITAPLVLMALFGVLPPPRSFTAWLVLSGPRLPVMAMGILMVSTLLSSLRARSRVPDRSSDVAFLMLTLGAIGLGAASILQSEAQVAGRSWLDGVVAMRRYWIVAGVAELAVFWACVLWCVRTLTPAQNASLPAGVVSGVSAVVVIPAILACPVVLHFT